jgi:hypothetical protein
MESNYGMTNEEVAKHLESLQEMYPEDSTAYIALGLAINISRKDGRDGTERDIK